MKSFAPSPAPDSGPARALVTGLFPDRSRAQRAVQTLEEAGFPRQAIDLAVPEPAEELAASSLATGVDADAADQARFVVTVEASDRYRQAAELLRAAGGEVTSAGPVRDAADGVDEPVPLTRPEVGTTVPAPYPAGDSPDGTGRRMTI